MNGIAIKIIGVGILTILFFLALPIIIINDTAFGAFEFARINHANLSGNLDEITDPIEKDFYARTFEISKQIKDSRNINVNMALYVSTFMTIQKHDFDFLYTNITNDEIMELFNNQFVSKDILTCTMTIVADSEDETENIVTQRVECTSANCVCNQGYTLQNRNTMFTFSKEQYENYLRETFLLRELSSIVLFGDEATIKEQLNNIIEEIFTLYDNIIMEGLETADLTHFSLPISPIDCIITSPYGERIDPISGKIAFHHGIDVVTRPKEIYSVADGVVTFVRSNVVGKDVTKGGGNIIIITHEINGIKYESVYAHLEYGSIMVKVGDTVRNQQVIAIMGTTGYSTGVHLHFEVKIDDVRVNPGSLFVNDCRGLRFN